MTRKLDYANMQLLLIVECMMIFTDEVTAQNEHPDADELLNILHV